VTNGAATRSCNDVRPVAFQRIAVVGAGAWGTALALAAHRAGRRAILWAREASVVDSIARSRRNPFLESTVLPAGIPATSDLATAFDGAELVLLATPSQHLRAMVRRSEALLAPSVPVVICSKGIEAGSGRLMSEVVAEEMPDRSQAVLSGPTFAAEVAAALPTAVTVAASPGEGIGFDHSHHLAARVAVTFATATFRPYLSADVIGVETGGAVKNVVAIACGIAAGRALGSNARAALITRGLAEMTRLTVALGGRADTLSGLAGAGDLMLTCSSEQSRNFSYGKALGEGQRPARVEDGPVVEGTVNAGAVMALARRLGVEMPICQAVEGILRGRSIDDAMAALMTSDLRPEPLVAEDEIHIPHPAVPPRRRELLSA
jgi:glycerol-3-phosphate dehydrogenase (NAD(P)+)